jgi:hypothetical protein
MHALQWSMSIAAAVMLLTALAPSADAGRQWCRGDPVVAVAGTKVSIEVANPDEHQRRAVGPLKDIVYVPAGINASVVWLDEGFNGLSEEVVIVPSQRHRVARTGISISAQATVPADRNDVSVKLFLTPDGGRTTSASGRSSATVSASAKVLESP